MKSSVAIAGGAIGLLALTLAIQSSPAAEAAASQLMSLYDPISHSRARIDSGKVRVGDGSGPVTVDGSLKTAPTSTSLSGTAVVPSDSVTTVLRMAPPTCPAGQAFLVEELSGSPSPTATFPNGVHQASITPAWGASLPLSQRLAGGSTRRSALAFAVSPRGTGITVGTLNGEARSPGGVPATLDHGNLPVTVEIFDSQGHYELTVDIQVTGRCGTAPTLPS